MKIKKPSGKKVQDTLAQGAGMVTGMKLSKGVSGVIPIENKTMAKALVAVVGLGVAVAVSGEDTASKAIRAVGLGMTAQQGSELIDTAVEGKLPANQFLQDSFGGSNTPVRTLTTEARQALAARMDPSNFRMANAYPENPSHGNWVAQ